MANDEKFLTMRDIAARYQITRAAVNRWMKDGRFPLGCHIGRLHRWPLSQLQAWEAARVAEATA